MASRPQRGTGYIGLEQWLGQNSKQAGAMANSLTSGIDAQGARSEALLGDAWDRFKGESDASAQNYDDTGFFNQNGSSADFSLAPMRARADAAEKFVADGYKGPKTIDEYASYGQGQAIGRNAQRDANLAADFYGRQALLQERAGKGGGYSLGQQRLDSALVGAAGGDRIDSTKAQWGGLLGKYDNTAKRATDYAARVEQNNKDVAVQQRETATKYGNAAAAARDKAKEEAGPVLQAEKDAERAERNRERIAERERQKREDGGGKGGGGKTNVDRWTDSYLF